MTRPLLTEKKGETAGEIIRRRIGRDHALEAATRDLIERLRGKPMVLCLAATKQQISDAGGSR